MPVERETLAKSIIKLRFCKYFQGNNCFEVMIPHNLIDDIIQNFFYLGSFLINKDNDIKV